MDKQLALEVELDENQLALASELEERERSHRQGDIDLNGDVIGLEAA